MFYPRIKSRRSIIGWMYYLRYKLPDYKEELEARRKYFHRFVIGDNYAICSWNNQDNNCKEWVISF
jgi:hypothetical protein